MNNSVIIESNAARQRFDRFCRKYFKPYTHISLKDIYSWIRKGEIRVNGTKKPENYMLELGDEVKFHPTLIEQCVGKAEVKSNPAVIENWMKKMHYKRDNLILYEDKDWLIRNKPVGIVIHEGNKHTDDITMNELLDYYVKAKGGRHKTQSWKEKNADSDKDIKALNPTTFKPAFAYRLDKDTTGVLVSAKTYPALQHINAIIRDHNITKEYYARVEGELIANKQLIDAPLFKGYNATVGRAQSFVNHEKWIDSQTLVTTEKVIENKYLGALTLVKCQLLSGKMHQIRVHMAHIGHPVIGDIMYGNVLLNRIVHKQYKINRQLLHSHSYSFVDHAGKTIQAIAPFPSDFEKFE